MFLVTKADATAICTTFEGTGARSHHRRLEAFTVAAVLCDPTGAR
jgi:hypothetical protein